MQCSKCGFVMSELDTECLRCKRLGDGAPVAPAATLPPLPVEEKECPRCGKATNISATLCDKCGYEYQPELSRAERYQALLNQEGAGAVPPSALRQNVSPALSWGIIGACLLAIGGAGWGIFGGSATGISAENVMEAPIIMSHHHKGHHGVGLQSVTYSVTGTAAQAFVTYQGANGVSVSLTAPVNLPWMETLQLKPGASVSLSAKPSGQTGTVLVAIQAGSSVRKQADMPGADGLTTVTDTL